MGNHHTVTQLTEPNLNLAVRQQGNFIIIGLDLPRSSGSVNQSPFTEVTRSEGTNLLNGAKTAFLEKLNGSGIDFKDVDVARGQTASGSVGAKLPKLANGEIAVEITSEVKGGVSFRSGKVGEAISAAEYNYDQNRKVAYQDRAYEWATNGTGATSTNPATGDTYYTSPEVAKSYHNKRFPVWGDPRRADSGEDSPAGNIASAKINGSEGADFAKHAGQVDKALDKIDSAGRPKTDANPATSAAAQAPLSAHAERLLTDAGHEVRQMAEKNSLPWDQGMSNTATAVAAAARGDGLTAINLFAVHGGEIRYGQLEGGVLKDGALDAKTAANTPQPDSMAKLAGNDKLALAEARGPSLTPSEPSLGAVQRA